jgi:hypothetical protein
VKNSPRKLLILSLLMAGIPYGAGAVSLDLGANYRVRAISAGNKLPSEPSLSFYTHRLQLYMGTQLSRDVEAKFQIQAINPWGLEGSTATAVQNTRYPSANGTPWIQTAYLRAPKLLGQSIQLTVGRQPITWGDGFVLTDDELGFDAIRVQAASPWPTLPLDTDIFYAKISDGLIGPARDFGLFGALLGTGTEKIRRMEIYWLEESDGSGSPYEAGAETVPVRSSQITRQFLGFRMKGTIRDAYYKVEYAQQTGFVDRSGLGSGDLTFQGYGLTFETGGTLPNQRFGLFNGFFNFAMGTGDAPGNGLKDGAFRPTFAHRWDGLERSGYGRYFAANVSDAYSTAALFSNSSSAQTGLPPGTSGIQILGGGIGYSPALPFKAEAGYYNYQAKESRAGATNLGSEIDLTMRYQYTGFLSFRGIYARFSPGDAYAPNPKTANLTQLEAEIKF